MRPPHPIARVQVMAAGLVLGAVAVLVLPLPALGQICAGGYHPGPGLELAAGGGGAFTDVAGRGTWEDDRGAAALGYRHRSFEGERGPLTTVTLEVAMRRAWGDVTVCPVTGLSRGSVESLTVWLVPLGVELSRPFVLSPESTLTPFARPALVWSHSSFGVNARSSVDPAVELGAIISFGRVWTGAAWERRFLDGVDGSWRGFAGVHWNPLRGGARDPR